MKKLMILSIGVFLGLTVDAQNNGDGIIGHWTNEDKSRVIEFVKNESSYEAIIRMAEDSTLIGKKQIAILKYARYNTYNEGTLFIIQRNKKVNCSAKLISEDELELKASYGLISKKMIWTSVEI